MTKGRPARSCVPCRYRKVKCDRIKPCGACCLSGKPAECNYTVADQEGIYLEQAEAITNLKSEVNRLKDRLSKIEKSEISKFSPFRESNLQANKEDGLALRQLYELILSAPSETVDHAVAQLRAGVPLDDIVAGVKDNVTIGSNALVSKRLSQYKKPGIHSTKLERPTLRPPARSLEVKSVLLDVLLHRFLNAFGSQGDRRPDSISMLHQATALQNGSPLLSKAFESASLIFVGRHDGNRRIEQQGYLCYSKLLSMLQNAVNHPRTSRSTETLVAVVLSTVIEAFKQSSKKAILHHQLGGLEIMRLRSPYRHCGGIERSIFVDFRMYWVSAALVHRKPSFMANTEWITVPWSGETVPKDILHCLLDIAVEIPGYLAQLDDLLIALNTRHLPQSELSALQCTVFNKGTSLNDRLKIWETGTARNYHKGWLIEMAEGASVPREGQIPTFRCRDPLTAAIITPPTIMYPDLLLAQSMTFYWALRLVISATPHGLEGIISSDERYELARNICRSTKYYIQMASGLLVSRLMFGIRAAFDTFADGTVEKQFVIDMFEYLGRRSFFSMFTNKCSESSVTDGPENDQRRTDGTV